MEDRTDTAQAAGQVLAQAAIETVHLRNGLKAFWLKGKLVPVYAGGAPDDPPSDPPADPATDPAQAASSGTGDDPPGGADPNAGNTGDDLSSDDAKKLIAELRREAAANRKKAKDAEAALKAKEDGEKSELEKAQTAAQEAAARADKAEADLREAVATSVIREQARDMGFVDPDVAARLVDREELDTNDDGKPIVESVRLKLADLAKSKAYLLGGTGGSPGNPGGAPKGSKFTIDDVRKMSPAEVNKNWDEVQAVLKAG